MFNLFSILKTLNFLGGSTESDGWNTVGSGKRTAPSVDPGKTRITRVGYFCSVVNSDYVLLKSIIIVLASGFR